MNFQTIIAAGLLAACAAPACARDAPPPPLPAREPAHARMRFVADCVRPVLPTQREVGAWTGLHNFGRVYAERARLMAEIARACRRSGASHIRIVFEADHPRDARRTPPLPGRVET